MENRDLFIRTLSWKRLFCMAQSVPISRDYWFIANLHQTWDGNPLPYRTLYLASHSAAD